LAVSVTFLLRASVPAVARIHPHAGFFRCAFRMAGA
jgi:hypothetical protein